MKNKILKKYKNLNVAIKASIWFTFCSILQRGISTLTIPIFTRIMTTEQFGKYTIFQTWYNILIIVVTMNIQSEIFNKGLSDNLDEKDNYSYNQSVLLVLLTFIFLLIYLIFNKTINNILNLSTFLVIFLFIEILSNALINLWYARKRFDYKYKPIILITILISVLNPLISIPIVYITQFKAESRIVVGTTITAIVSIILFFNIRKYSNKKIRLNWWKSAILLSIPLVPHYLSLVLLNQTDKIMIEKFCGLSYAAIYSIAHSAGLIMTIVNNSINASFVPWAYNKLKKNENQDIQHIANTLYLIVGFCCILFIWFGPEFIKFFAPQEYYEAIWCIVPIATSVFFFFIYMLFADIEIYYGENKYVSIASIFSAVLNIILNYLFIPVFGYIAAGYTTLFSYISTMIIHYIFLNKILKKHNVKNKIFDIKSIITKSFLILLLSSLAMVLYNKIIIRILIILIISLITLKYRKKIYNSIVVLINKEKKNENSSN